MFQSTLPVKGATIAAGIVAAIPQFQSTLPVKGATYTVVLQTGMSAWFQSTLPVKGATPKSLDTVPFYEVSIHAPREGSDENLNHQPPMVKFQSTLPVKGATMGLQNPFANSGFQSTLPVKGATVTCDRAGATTWFQSTLPVKGATT